MPDDIQLQILPGPQIALTSRGARVASVPAMSFTLPPAPLEDAAALWQALPPPVQAALSALHDLQPGEPLPLWLDVQLPEVAAWRWELLVPPGKPATLAFSMAMQTPLVRYVAAGAAAKPRPGVPRLLAVGASPRQQAPLDIASLVQNLAARHDPQRLLVTTEPRCGPERLAEALCEAPNMLVIIAHGAPGAVLLEDEYGDEVPLTAAELAALVKDTPVRAVVLAGCHGATPHGDAGATAEVLLRSGVLGVIAMRGAVSTEASAAFLDGLLDAVSDGQPLEVAAAAGRRMILTRYGEHSAWAAPVCWQRALHRPLTLAPPALLRRGAARLTDRAPSWATQLATGGALGLLLASALAPLLPATGITTSALVTLLGNLGLNVFSGYLGDALAKVWQRTGGGPETATPDEVAAALQEIVQSQADAATHLADLARASRATGALVEAINRGVAGNTALLEGLKRDLAAHGEEITGLRADLRAGLAAVYREQLRLGDELRAGFEETLLQGERIETGINAIRDRMDAAERARHEQEHTWERQYLQAVITQYETVSLARFADVKRGTGEDALPTPSLDQIFTALTTEEWRPIHLRKSVRPAGRVRRLAQRLAKRRSPDVALPDAVRRLGWRSTARGMPSDYSGDVPPGNIPDDAPLEVRLRRPELAVEVIAPRDDAMPRLLLLGDPGSGKSTVLRYVAVRLARCRLDHQAVDLPGWREPRLPLLLSLGRLGDALAREANELKALNDALAEILSGQGQRPGMAALLPTLLPRSALLLDGLDELSAESEAGPRHAPRYRAARAICRLAAQLPKVPIIVTCRVLPYHDRDPQRSAVAWQRHFDEHRWEVRTVQPFAFGQVRGFVRAWYRCSIPAYPQRADERAADLLEQLDSGEERQANSLRQAIAAGSETGASPRSSPLLLTMLTILHYNREGRRLPEERDQLYEELVRLLLHTWEPVRSKPDVERLALEERLRRASGRSLSIDVLRNPVHEAAYDAHQLARGGGDGRGVLDRDKLYGKLMRYFTEEVGLGDEEAARIVRLFLNVLREEAGLLVRIGDNAYALPHLTFQEYLAACHLAGMSAREMVAEVYRHWRGDDRDRWREVIRLLTGRLCQQQKGPDHGAELVRALADHQEEDGSAKPLDQRQRDALLASDCRDWLEARGALLGRTARECRDRVRDALQAIIPPEGMRADQIHLPIADRARAGIALARLGAPDAPADARPGVCTLPAGLDDPYWAQEIPVGTYAIGTQRDPFNNETFKPVRVKLASFRIARYLVTVWQYRQFVAAGGYQDEQWWTEEGWKWLQPGGFRWSWQEQGRITKPYLWDDPDWTADNQPVVGVSWYEAMAFCNWLKCRVTLPDGWEIGLPTEAEWEAAAMWDAAAGVMRAWQPPANELWQNVKEAGIGRTCPVGLFPQGASPCGALDMAGNAWEWCASPHKGYPAQAHERPDDYPPNRIGPALRGGSWYQENARSGWGARGRGSPDHQDDDRGFRLGVRLRFAH